MGGEEVVFFVVLDGFAQNRAQGVVRRVVLPAVNNGVVPPLCEQPHIVGRFLLWRNDRPVELQPAAGRAAVQPGRLTVFQLLAVPMDAPVPQDMAVIVLGQFQKVRRLGGVQRPPAGGGVIPQQPVFLEAVG